MNIPSLLSDFPSLPHPLPTFVPSQPRPHFSQRLKNALMDNNPNRIRRLFQVSPRLNPAAQDEDGNTALHFAVLTGRDKAVLELIKNRKVFEKRDQENNAGQTALQLARRNTHKNHAKIMAILEEAEIVNATNETGETPLMEACQKAFYSKTGEAVFKMLQCPTLNVNIRNRASLFRGTALLQLFYLVKMKLGEAPLPIVLEIFKAFLQVPSLDLREKDAHGKGVIEHVEEFIRRNEADKICPSLLMALLNHPTLRIQIPEASNQLLSMACQLGKKTPVLRALELGGDLNAKNHHGETPLMLSLPRSPRDTRQHYKNAMGTFDKLLDEADLDVTICDNYEQNILHHIVNLDDEETALRFLKRLFLLRPESYVLIDVSNRYGATPLQLAERNRKPRMANELRRIHSEALASNVTKSTPLPLDIAKMTAAYC